MTVHGLQREKRSNIVNVASLPGASNAAAPTNLAEPAHKKPRSSPVALRSVEKGHPIMQYKYMCPKTYQKRFLS